MNAIGERLRLATAARPEPVPLRSDRSEAQPFPLGALGDRLGRAAEAIMARVQVPDALAAHSVLAAASLAVQGHAVVRLPTGQIRPLSLFLATIADSGDRKTSADTVALAPIHEYERELSAQYAMDRQIHAAEHAVWKSANDTIAKNGKGQSRDVIAAQVDALGLPPAEPMQPVIIVPPGSTQGIISVLEKGRPSVGLFINEGGSWLGSWGMQDENRTASISAYSEMWDGQPIKTLTKSDGFKFLPDRAFAFHVMFQQIYTQQLFGNEEMRGQGFLSRILAAQPQSLAGQRFDTEGSVEPSHIASDLADYHEQLARIIRAPLPVDPKHPNGLIHRRELTFDPAAAARLRRFYNHVEGQQAPGGTLASLRGFAGKATEQVARLASIIHVFDHGLSDLVLTAEDVNRGTELLNFYIGEAQRLADCTPVDALTVQAEALSRWLETAWESDVIAIRAIQQNAPRGTGAREKADHIRELCAILVRHDHLTSIPAGATIDGKHCREAWRINVGR